MKKIQMSILLIYATMVSGCASAGDYAKYADTQLLLAQERTKVEVAKATADAARYAAISNIAATGDSTAKAVGMMALQNSGNAYQSSLPNQGTGIERPKSFSDTALQWTAVLLPSLTNIFGIVSSRHVAETQSNNNRDVAISTTNGFVSMGSLIQAPAANMTYTVDGSGATTIGSGSSSVAPVSNVTETTTATTTTTTDDHGVVSSYNPITNPYVTLP